MVSFEFKVDEIKQYINDELDDIDDDELRYRMSKDGEMDEDGDLHNMLFNTDYYVSTQYGAMNWCNNDLKTFIKLQKEVRRYEEDNFGELITDITKPIKVVNMYVYIIGKQLLPKILEERYKKEMSEVLDERLSNNDSNLVDKIWSFFAWFYHN